VKINIQIERLVLDRLPIARHQGPLLKAAVEAELSRLFAAGGSDSVLSSGAMFSMSAPSFQIASKNNPMQLGQQIGQAVYGGFNKGIV
jgi:hypothetical protein